MSFDEFSKEILDAEKKAVLKELITQKKDLDKRAEDLKKEMEKFNTDIRALLGVTEKDPLRYDDLLLKVL